MYLQKGGNGGTLFRKKSAMKACSAAYQQMLTSLPGMEEDGESKLNKLTSSLRERLRVEF